MPGYVYLSAHLMRFEMRWATGVRITVEDLPACRPSCWQRWNQDTEPGLFTAWVYDVGSRADIAAEWAMSCKEYRDDSSRACEAGNVGWDSILKMADTCIALLRRSIAAPVPLCT